MKSMYKPLCATLLACAITGAQAQDSNYDYNSQQTSENTQKMVKYLLNLGAYLGYNLQQAPGSGNDINTNATLLDVNKLQLAQTYAFYTLMGATPVNAISQALSQFVPQGQKGLENLNAFANYIFNQQNYSSASGQKGGVTVNTLIDQKNYQNDPVSQNILNILTTPDSSFCVNHSGVLSWQQDCDFLYQRKVAKNVIGEIPGTQKFFSFQAVQPVLSQLNSNALMGPLLYDLSDPSAQGTGSPTPQQNGTEGLTAVNQAQNADNFIRYASGMVNPISLPAYQQYDQLYTTMINKNLSELERKTAEGQLSTYLASLRSYTAKMSVGIGNLYYIFAKRMPQKQTTEGSQQSSQALTEYTMATHRLFNPDKSANRQWINNINNASSATVQKEMAVLLAEINYQLYLNRQQQERILLTNSISLMQNTMMTLPSLDTGSGTGSTSN